MQDALKRSEEMYRTLAETAQDMIFMIDRDDRVIYVNTYGRRRLGARPMDLIGKKRFELFPPMSPRGRPTAEQGVRDRPAAYYEDVTRFPDRSLWLSTWLTPIIGQSGKTEAVLASHAISPNRKKRSKHSRNPKRGIACWSRPPRT